ncbi:MAG: helix-turn-helix transcriptional regulator [Bacteroidales bacterium]|jgi:transcriptional regulator with XRE-family HTH domain|nr:helix-turn-helix transcriptional regulator [Bacteroidales bacterium]
MKDRIQAFLQNENKSYAQFAEEIGVQPSGISHILSGRNNPSLDFVIKMLHKYPALSAEWLLFGRGSMYKYTSQPTLFDTEVPQGSSDRETTSVSSGALPDLPEVQESRETPVTGRPEAGLDSEISARRLTRIVMFYSDKSFTEYMPS